MMHDLALGSYSLGITRPIPMKIAPRLTVRRIQEAVADYYELPLRQMTDVSKMRSVARPRQVAMYLSRKLTGKSLPDIGSKFGGRDHTTVLHAVRRIDDLRITNLAIKEDVEILSEMLAA